MNPGQPIAIFDSGVGGLSVAKKIREALPQENILYIADSAHAPYGNKSQQYIVQRSVALVEFMLQQQAKIIVVACNTATLSAIKQLRSSFTLPIIGVEPGIKPASVITQSGVIGVMVTTRTAQLESFHELLQRYSNNLRIEVQPCEGLVEQIEQGDLLSLKTHNLIASYVEPLLSKGVDVIALGCTHYPFIMPVIENIVGHKIKIIETGTAVAKQVVRRMQEENCLAPDNQIGQERFYTTGDAAAAEVIMSDFWGYPVEVLKCSI